MSTSLPDNFLKRLCNKYIASPFIQNPKYNKHRNKKKNEMNNVLDNFEGRPLKDIFLYLDVHKKRE